ncbi:hypothetical protein C8R43DRAFT_1155725 [Mycena crocata]|nr:hypothetical protein C8R43DRAFT_1155725 [Mycena crocata]
MHLKSPFPPLPPLPEVNVHHVLLGRPDQADRADYTIQIEEDSGRKRTFKEMVKRIGWGATALGAKVADGGLELNGDSEEMVGLLGDNSLEYFDLVHSLLMITTPMALISTYSTRFELVHALKLTKVTRLFVDAKLLKNVLAATEDPTVQLTRDKIYILSRDPMKGWRSFKQIIDEVQYKNVPLEPVRPATRDTVAYLVMSSGTSGLPKAVMITHGNVIASMAQLMAVGQAKNPSPGAQEQIMPIILSSLPMFHTYGLTFYILCATMYPATYIIMGRWDTTREGLLVDLYRRYRATHLTVVPSAVHQLVNHPDIKTTDLSSVMYLTSGAAHLPPELAKRMMGLLPKGSDFSEGYGLSECTIFALTHASQDMLDMHTPPKNATGILVSGVEARIVRDDGSAASLAEVGELWLRGPNISMGYWNNAQATAETFVDGWLRTGDKFRVDENGFFFFADRAKDTLKVSGVQVSPKEIEEVLFAHPGELISDVAVVGVSGGRTADEKVPRAWIVLSSSGKKKGAPAVIQALETWHKASLSKYKWLRGGIEVVHEIPKSPTGKVMKRILQEEYEKRAKKVKANL